MNTTPNENNENLENENVAEVEIEETAEAVSEEETTAAEEVEEITEEAVEAAEEVIEEAVALEEISGEEAVEPISEEATEDAPKKCKKAFGFAGLIALILVCAFLWVMYSGIFAPKYAPTYDNSELTCYYIKDNEVKGRKDNGDVYTVFTDSTIASEADALNLAQSFMEETTFRSADGTAIYFYENFDTSKFTGDLYVIYKDKAKIKIDSDVAFGATFVSPNGKSIIYAKTTMNEDGMGIKNVAFYLYRKGKTPVLIYENVSMNVAPVLSQSGEYFAYCVDNAETQMSEVYTVRTTDITPKSKKVADNATTLLSVKDNGYVFYTVGAMGNTAAESDADLYYASAKKAPVKVADDIATRPDWIGQQTNNFAYCIENEDKDTEYYFGAIGKTPKKRFAATAYATITDVENTNALFFVRHADDTTKFDLTAMYGKKLLPIDNDINSQTLFERSRDHKKMFYFKNYDEKLYTGDLFFTEVKFGKVNTKLVSQNVFNVFPSKDGDYVAYFANVDSTSISSALSIFDGKNSKKVADNVFFTNIYYTDNDTKIFYMADCTLDQQTGLLTGTLKMSNTKNPNKTKIIDKDVTVHLTTGLGFSVRDDGSVYYMKNYDASAQKGDLYFAKNGKTGTLVEKGVSKLILE